jgi:hypothetical protein
MSAATSFAASCCGGGSAAPTMITGDDLAQFSASLSQGQVIGDAPTSGLPVFRADGDTEQIQTLRLEGAYLLTDRWQTGASLALSRRSRVTSRTDSSSASGLGDITLSAAYEVLPEWEYSAWKPRGFLFAQFLIPTGGSIYEASFSATQPWGLDSRGRGFDTGGLGALFTKSWSSWDSSILVETHRAFSRTFATAPGPLKLIPGWGASASAGAGYSPSGVPVRFGLSLAPSYEGGIASEGTVTSSSDSQLVWNTSAQLGWMVTHGSTLSAIYTDQTLVGPASNASLSRTFALSYQKRWER